MIIFAPYVDGMLRRETEAWLQRCTWSVRRFPGPSGVWRFQIDERDPLQYGEMLSQTWTKCVVHDLDLMVVEQDVVPPILAADDFMECGHWWCSNSYNVQWGNIAEVYRPSGAALGCTRFHRDLMRREPGLIREALERHEFPRKPPGHYLGLDSAIYHVLMARGYESHRHYPDATHLHEYPKLPEEQTANG